MFARPTRRHAAFVTGALAATFVLVGTPAAADAGPAVHQGDMLIPNYSFESDLADWSAKTTGPDCAGAVRVTTGTAKSGSRALRLQTDRTCVSAEVESARLDAQAGQRYSAFASVDAASGRAKLALRFYDASGALITGSGPVTSSGAEGWRTLSASGVAPAGTTSVSVVASNDPSQLGTVYIDDVLVSAQVTDLGPQIHHVSLNAETYGKGPQGQDEAFVVETGASNYDAHLVVIDMDTAKVVDNLPLPGATGAWNATTATDGRVYIGSYGTEGHLFRYTPGAASVEDLGQAIPGDSYIWDLAAGPDGSVYGAGYPSGGAFRYDPASGFSQLGPRPLYGTEVYARAIAYDRSVDLVYVGIGAHAHLVACAGHGTAPCQDILPTQYQSQEFTYNLTAGNGYVFARMEISNELFVLHVIKAADGTISSTLVADLGPVDNLGTSPLIGGKVYYTRSSRLWSYDTTTGAATSLGVTLSAVNRWGLIQLNDQANWPGQTLVGVNSLGRLVKYNVQTGRSALNDVPDLPGAPTDIQSITRGPDGRIYSGGYFTGGLGAYTPLRSDLTTEHTGVGQEEGMTTLGNKLYFGTYPLAHVIAYQPDQPWQSGTNPLAVCYLGPDGQDRPYGMLGADGKVFVGTMAQYGQLQGGLTVYDPATGNCALHKNIVPDESIVSLAYADGKVYGGTLIWGGFGSTPTQTEAKLLVYDVASDTSRIVPLPVRGLRSLTGLTVGPDGNLWMTAENYLLVYNPRTAEWVYSAKAFTNIDYSSVDRILATESNLVVGKDGDIYGTIHSSELFRIDPLSKHVTVLWNAGAVHLTQDDLGNLYFVTSGNHLVRFVI